MIKYPYVLNSAITSVNDMPVVQLSLLMIDRMIVDDDLVEI
jgi:hypothetical protein